MRIFRADGGALFNAAAGEERSETHYAEKRWGREMASKRRKSGVSGKEGKKEGSLEGAGKQFCGGKWERRRRAVPAASQEGSKIVRAPVI